MPENEVAGEVLIIRGTVDETGRFLQGRCGSTFYVRRWPRVEDGLYLVELLDDQDRPLHHAQAEVCRENTCDVLDVERYAVTAYIGLHDQAVAVQLRNGDLVLWRTEIPPPATVDVWLGSTEVKREDGAMLRLDLSPPGKGAYVTVIYQWAERGFQTVDITAPTQAYTVDMRAAPGGPACRFIVIYSNGLRSGVAVTQEFQLDPLGPAAMIVSPSPDMVVHSGQHVTLHGQVVDVERPRGAALERLTWYIDGEPVGRGPISGVDDLAVGTHRIALRYGDEARVEAEVVVRVRPTDARPANEWDEFNPFP